jgi:hypothetical protein
MRRYYSPFPDVFCKREIFTVKFEQIDTNNIGPSAQHFDKVAVGFIEKHEPAFKQVVHYTEQTWRSCRASNSRCALRHSAMLRVEARVGEGARCLHWCP